MGNRRRSVCTLFTKPSTTHIILILTIKEIGYKIYSNLKGEIYVMEAILKSKPNLKILVNVIYVVSAIALPQVFHLFGMNGAAFLPMHIPVLLAGLTLGPAYGLVVGVVSPVISTFLTGMPLAFPMLPIMILELGTYGLAAGLLNKYTKLKILNKIILTMIFGRIVYAIAYAIIKTFLLPTIEVNSVIDAILVGLPGIMLQIILIPYLYNNFIGKGQKDV